MAGPKAPGDERRDHCAGPDAEPAAVAQERIRQTAPQDILQVWRRGGNDEGRQQTKSQVPSGKAWALAVVGVDMALQGKETGCLQKKKIVALGQ